MIRYYNEIWLEKKQDALYDALEEIENILNYETKDVPYDDDFEDEIKFIKDNIGYLETLEKEIEEFLTNLLLLMNSLKSIWRLKDLINMLKQLHNTT